MTGENDHPGRPNANYKLSKPDNDTIGEENLVFHYNREHRLAKAPQSVRDLYKENKYSKFNLLRPLIADKPRATVFFTIVILCVVILMLSFLGYFDRAYTLDGNKIGISARGYEGTAIIVLKKTVKNGAEAYTGAIDIAAFPAVQEESEQSPMFIHRIFFTFEPEEEYRFVVPFDSPEIFMHLQTEKSIIKIKVKVD